MMGFKNFLAEKKSKIILGTLLTGASYVAYNKLRNISNSAEIALRSRDRRLKTYFEESQQAIASIVHQQIPNIYEQLKNIIEVPHPTQLRSCKTREEKLAMWETVEIQSFTRLLTGLYTIVLMSVLLRIQINLVGRYIHKDQVELGSQPSTTAPLFDEAIQEKYLGYSEYLVNNGLERLAELVRQAAQRELANWPLDRQVAYEDMLLILLSIRRDVEAPPSALLDVLLPPENACDLGGEEILSMLLGETRNILESQPFHAVFKKSLDYAFLQVTQNLRPSFASEPEGSKSSISNESDTAQGEASVLTDTPAENTVIFPTFEQVLSPVKMAKVIPIVQLQFDFILRSTTSTVVETLTQFQPLQMFSYALFTKTS